MQMEAKGYAVLALVAHDAFPDLPQLGCGILEARDRYTRHDPGCLTLGGLDLLAKGGQIVVGYVDGGLGAQHEAILATGERHEVLEAVRIAAEQALGLAGFHVSQIQERPVAVLGGSAAAEVDRVALLAQDPPAVLQRPVQRIARGIVAVVLVQIEPALRFAGVDVE